MNIERGRRIGVADIFGSALEFTVELRLSGPLTLDVSCFGLDAAGRLLGDEYLVFYNQPDSPCGGVRLTSSQSQAQALAFALDKLPSRVERLCVTAAIDGSGTMSQLQPSHALFLQGNRELARFSFSGGDFAAERAIMIAEIYRKSGTWRVSAIGQGFNGGMDALVRHFGGEVADPASVSPSASGTPQSPARPPAPSRVEAPGAAAPPAPGEDTRRVNLEKRIEREAPHLVSLVKQAKVSLAKAGLLAHTARVALCLDVSGSMSGLYGSGAVQALAQRVLALGCRFDDDGEIDVFVFADLAKYLGGMNIGNSDTALSNAYGRAGVGYGTSYSKAIELIEQHYFGGSKKLAVGLRRLSGLFGAGGGDRPLPVYVMFLTDGNTSDEGRSAEAMRRVSQLPIFWQFMAIGSPGQFSFLKKLDTMSGRYLDNANFFCVGSPTQHPDDQLFDLLMGEYPQWVKEARAKGMIA